LPISTRLPWALPNGKIASTIWKDLTRSKPAIRARHHGDNEKPRSPDSLPKGGTPPLAEYRDGENERVVGIRFISAEVGIVEAPDLGHLRPVLQCRPPPRRRHSGGVHSPARGMRYQSNIFGWDLH
jgi:hypothetical protein